MPLLDLPAYIGMQIIEAALQGTSAAAVANAVYKATGVRVSTFPMTLDKLLPGLPA